MRVRQKQCDRCSRSLPVLYRVRVEEEGEWMFVCDDCLPAVKDDNPHYTYGGTWKSTKKR